MLIKVLNHVFDLFTGNSYASLRINDAAIQKAINDSGKTSKLLHRTNNNTSDFIPETMKKHIKALSSDQLKDNCENNPTTAQNYFQEIIKKRVQEAVRADQKASWSRSLNPALIDMSDRFASLINLAIDHNQFFNQDFLASICKQMQEEITGTKIKMKDLVEQTESNIAKLKGNVTARSVMSKLKTELNIESENKFNRADSITRERSTSNNHRELVRG